MTRICFDILRRTSAPISDRDIALVSMTARGMDTNDARLVKLILSASAAACASANAAARCKLRHSLAHKDHAQKLDVAGLL